MKRAAAMLILSAALAGCVVGPDYARPAPPPKAAPEFQEAGATPNISSDPAVDQWWKLFDDPVLDRLVQRALARNADIRIAVANLLRARAVVGQARSRYLPATEASAQASRRRARVQSGTPGQGQAVEFDFFSVGFDAAYELDLFGSVSRSVEAARGDEGAARAELDAARIAVAAETARTYAQLCGFAEQLAVARETLELQRRTLELTDKLREAGRGTRRDVARATVLAEQVAAQIPQLDAERRASLYALTALTGDTPAEADAAAAACTAPPMVKTIIPIGDGAALLARRPDIARAERLLAADTARIGVATAELFPSIQLLGSVGLTATSLNELTRSSASTFSLGPLISWRIPNITAARSRIQQARAQSQASLAVFDGTVLLALQETEQALARYAGAIERRVALARAEAASRDAARLTRIRYQDGADSFLDLLDAERSSAEARAALAQANANLAEAQVSLFKALGGGWQESVARDVASAVTPGVPQSSEP